MKAHPPSDLPLRPSPLCSGLPVLAPSVGLLCPGLLRSSLPVAGFPWPASRAGLPSRGPSAAAPEFRRKNRDEIPDIS